MGFHTYLYDLLVKSYFFSLPVRFLEKNKIAAVPKGAFADLTSLSVL